MDVKKTVGGILNDFYFLYIDESKFENKCFFSALWVPCSQWNSIFARLKSLRQNLSRKYAIYVRKELHATKFLGGRGRPSKKFISTDERYKIFKEVLSEISSWSELKLFNSVNQNENWALERLLNRVERTLFEKSGLGLIICDSGKEVECSPFREDHLVCS